MIENSTDGKTTVTLGYGNVIISTNQYQSGVYVEFRQLVEPGPIGDFLMNVPIEPQPHPSVCIMIDNLEAMKSFMEIMERATTRLIQQKRNSA